MTDYTKLGRYSALAGAVFTVIGAFLPWVTVTAPFLGTVSRSGMEGGDGPIFLALGAVAAGVTLVDGRSRTVVLMLTGTGVLGLFVAEWVAVTDRLESLPASDRSLATHGMGLYALAAGGIGIFAGGFIIRSEPGP